MAAILGASLSFFACESPTDGAAGSPGRLGPGFVSGAISVAALQRQIDLYADAGSELTFDSIEVTGAGVVDFKTVKAYVVGPLATDNSNTGGAAILNLANANIELGEGGNIALGHADDVAVGTAEQFAGKGTTGVYAETAAALPETAAEVGGVTAVKDLELDEDLTIASGLKVFVYGTLTINGTDDSPSGGYGNGIVAIGTVKVTEANTAALSADTNVDVTGATILYEGATAVAVTLPAALKVFAFKVTGEQGVLKVAGGTTSVEAAVTQNNGFVEFVSAVTNAAITGKGRIRFANPAGDGTATAFGTASDISASIIEFPNGFSTSESGTVALSGDVYIADGKAITFGHADGTLTLKEGSAVKAGTVKDNASDSAALNAAADTVLTPVATAALTATAGTTDTDPKLALGTANLTLTSGKLFVPADAELAVSSVALTIAAGAELKNAGTVTLTGTGSAGLTAAADDGGAQSTGTGTLTAGKTEITGIWQATGASGTVTVAAASANTASITGASPAGLIAGAGGAITQKTGESNKLTLTTVTLDLSANGSLTLKGAEANGGQVAMGAATAIVKLGSGATKVAKPTITGLTLTTNVAVNSTASNGTGLAVGSLVGGEDGTITADESDVTLDKNTKVDGEE
jgi:hypothetical protein